MPGSHESPQERQRRRHAERLARGTCTRCGKCAPESGLKLCRPCREKRRAAEKARRDWARAEGRIYAGRDPQATRRAARAADKRRRRARRDAGVCTSCGRGRPADGRSICEPCRGEQRATERERYAAPPNCRAMRAVWATNIRRLVPLRPVRRARSRAHVAPNAGRRPTGSATQGAGRRGRAWIARFLLPALHVVPAVPGDPTRAPPEPSRLHVPFPEYTVVRLDTGEVIDSFETEAEAAACLVFAGLRPDQVEIRANVPLMALSPP